MLVTDVASLARFILSPQCKSICILTGAGVSVASGIPDFRSPGGGMYATLQPQLLTATPQQRAMMEYDPTYVVSWDIFQQNPFPYLEVRRQFILGTQKRKWKATLAHRFSELLHTQTASLDSDGSSSSSSKLTRVYTQNIDGLDFQCDKIPTSKILSVHGSLSQVSCEGCGSTEMSFDEFCEQVRTNIKNIYQTPSGGGVTTIANHGDDDNDRRAPVESTPILCPSCHRPLVKPSTVLFGRSLPEEFFDKVPYDLEQCDLLLVMGTSLVVSPANSLVPNVNGKCKRVVINRERVGEELGLDFDNNHNNDGGGDGDSNNQRNDVFLQGDCEEVVMALLVELGWLNLIDPDLLPEGSAQMVRTKLNASKPL